MKIVIATPMYPPEIAEPATYSKEVAFRLSKENEVTIVAYASTSEHASGVTLFTVSKKRPLPFRLIKYTATLYKASKDADVIYAQSGMASSIPAVIVGSILKVPVVANYMENEPWKRALFLNLTELSSDSFLKEDQKKLFVRFLISLQSFVLRKASHVVTSSAHQKKNTFLAYATPEEKVTVIYNPPKKEELLPFEEKVIPHQITLSEKLTRWSGVNTALYAITEIKNDFPDIQLLISGNGPEKENLKALAEKLMVTEHVKFLGQISRAEKWYLLKTSGVYLSTNTEEVDPDKIIWRLNAGIPVIASNVPGNQEVIIHEKSGLLVSAGNQDELARELGRIFNDKELRSQLIEGGKKLLSEKCSWEKHVHDLNELFSSLKKHG